MVGASDSREWWRPKPLWSSSTGESTNKIMKSDRCGIACCRPICLEPLRDIRAFIAAACFISCLQASFSGYTSSQITTIEKRFAIGSIIIGLINSFFEVGYISCVMIVSYAGSKGRVPLWISSGLMAMSVGAFLYSTPHFVLPPPSSASEKNIDHLCPENFSENANSCIEDGVQGYDFLPCFLFAQFLIGAGSTPILTLAPPFVDDHVPPNKAPAMIASLYAAAALGPVFGYALGAMMIQYPADRITRKDITPDDPNWIGAWWAGYICLGEHFSSQHCQMHSKIFEFHLILLQHQHVT
ncbi:unnamed protein product [Dibothriocephalus latus]|uniref:Major facilitator superfamily (MFS) profile domain-containing protein n=1 Tax=Dibothriocephalus latus TaxID=60516 RepID=A0A3P7P7F2_DIBLA|nr:unnamed protein product [Dibothriocephalus latus]